MNLRGRPKDPNHCRSRREEAQISWLFEVDQRLLTSSPTVLGQALRSLVLALLLTCILSLTGCITKGRADARAREAYAAGQRETIARLQQQLKEPSVTVLGDVKNRDVPWTPDLTLAKAILAAGYNGRSEPSDIVLVRNGQGTQIDPRKLLSGEDIPLQAMDVVILRH